MLVSQPTMKAWWGCSPSSVALSKGNLCKAQLLKGALWDSDFWMCKNILDKQYYNTSQDQKSEWQFLDSRERDWKLFGRPPCTYTYGSPTCSYQRNKQIQVLPVAPAGEIRYCSILFLKGYGSPNI